jgi:hypothetical protein
MSLRPIANAELSMLEDCSAKQLLGMFGFCLKTGLPWVEYNELSDAWGVLFSKMFLSAEDLVDEMQSGEHRLGGDEERLLREFIRADCANGGAFVLNVIKKGGNMDRAALIMIADIGDLARIKHDGTTAIHLLVDACDKNVRPALITRAGKKLLSRVYDRNGIPVLFSIFRLSDLSVHDLDAIAKVFSREDLKKVMSRNRTGKNALEAFTDISGFLRSHAPRERNPFIYKTAIKTTNMEGDVRAQVASLVKNKGSAGARAKATKDKKAEPAEGRRTDISDEYALLMSNPLDDFGKTIKKSQRTK